MSVFQASHYTLADSAGTFWRWKNFTPAELACKGSGELLLDMDALDKLQLVRETLKVPLKINSAFRSPAHNAAEGGSKNSMHTKGKAFDISLKGVDPKVLYAAAKAAGFTGFGFYRTFLHVDTGRAREWGAHKGQFV
jgi:zinc D-Ala-D-Ala carboxypeptidase